MKTRIRGSLTARMKKSRRIPSWSRVSRWSLFCWCLRSLWQRASRFDPLPLTLSLGLGVYLAEAANLTL